jgi:NodT family efflux transporter outer membrane factor (OMF) lipoprotein
MRPPAHCRFARALPALVALLLAGAGCTPLEQWLHNGFKVGPNFTPPSAAVAPDWLDAGDPRVVHGSVDGVAWWNVFDDPALNALIDAAYTQNLDLRTAATRVLQAKAQRNIAAGNLFPQTQNAIGAYAHAQTGQNGGLPFGGFGNILNVWATGFNLSWELDFWGRIRRNIESKNAELDASIESYRDAMVTLQAEVATNYVLVRTAQQRIAFARRNVEIQEGSLRIAEARLKEGRATALDVEQAQSNLAQTQATIPPLEINLRQANNQLCLLLGRAPGDLVKSLSEAPIPAPPPEVAVGIPAELLHRRPDVRKALRDAAAQSAQIGIAEADFYPQFGVLGFIGFTADDVRRLFAEKSFTGLVAPYFQWKILNYGRIANNVRYQNANFQEKALAYQKSVLNAGKEVENALVGFLQAQLQAKSLEASVRAAEKSVELVLEQYKEGRVDYNRVFTLQAQLTTQQDQLAAARGSIAANLIAVYRALGGGWQVLESTPLPCAAGVTFLTPIPAE